MPLSQGVASAKSVSTPSVRNTSICGRSNVEVKSHKRTEINEKANELNHLIENCSTLHKSLLSEVRTQKQLTYANLDSMRKQLLASKANIVHEYEQWRTLRGSLEPDLKMRNTMDRVEADSELVLDKVLEKMNALSARDKSTNANNLVTSASQNFRASSLSQPIKSYSKPSLTRSSGASSSSRMRLMQVEAQAKAAALKKRLEAAEATQELEQQAHKLSMAIEQSKLKAELDAANAEENVFSQALDTQDMTSLLNPPPLQQDVSAQFNYEHANPQRVTYSPALHVANATSTLTPSGNEPQVNSHRNVDIPAALEPNLPDQILASTSNHAIPDHSFHRQSQNPKAAGSVNLGSSASDQQVFATTLAQAIHTIKLRPAEPTTFYGDPLGYLDWKVAFEGLIESGSYTPLQRLVLLQQYLGGKAKKAVASLFQIGTEEAFQEAKRKLDKRYGQPHVLSEAYRSKLEQWPLIKEHDGESLEELVDFLESCQTAMRTLPELRCLNDRRENVKVLEKLPLSVGNRWVQRATQIEENTLKFPSLNDFCNFLVREANVATSSLNKALAKRASNKRNESTSQNKHTKKATTLLATENTHTLTNDRQDLTKPKHVKYPCRHCDMDNHVTGECSKLSKLPHADIEKLFMSHKLCFSCAKPGHRKDQCKYPQNCVKKDCGKQHLSVFHEYYTKGKGNKPSPQTATNINRGSENKNSSNSMTNNHRGSENKTSTQTNFSAESQKSKQTDNEQPATVRNCTEAAHTPANVMSWTIPVYVSKMGNPEKEVLVYALLDSGSNRTFITKATLDKLNATTHSHEMNISTLTNTESKPSRRVAATGLLVRGHCKQRYLELPLCISQNKIPCNPEEIPDSMSVQDWPHLKHLSSEFISAEEGRKIELGLLIGSNLPQVFISRKEVSRKDHEPFARLTDLGWILMGNTAWPASGSMKAPHSHTIVNMTVAQPINRCNITFKMKANSSHKDDILENKILKIFSSDFEATAGEIKTLSIDDIQFLRTMNKHVYRDKDGYITMPLPIKHKPGPNRSKLMAINRFKLLQKKLSDRVLSDHYHKFMNDIISQGDAEIVPPTEQENINSWYIPHFGVYHPKKPNKIRVVFDGAAKVGGMCLNDHLLQGPDQLNSLIGILMRFRKEYVAVTCDIAKMFHQFRVSPEHRDYLRFLWYNNQGDIVSYRMKVHIFGATSSPACATFGLRTLCKMSSHGSNSLAKNFINHDFYVDDGLASFPDPDAAKAVVRDAISICKEGNLRLHKFASNSPELLLSLPKTERNLQDVHCLDVDDGSQPLERTLGLLWSLKSDGFQFSSELKETPNTRRGVLSSISSIYDPLGLLSPFILTGKAILQDICRSSASWDDPLRNDLSLRWKDWKASLSDLSQLSIPRCYKPINFGLIKKAEVHHFSDASTSGYGCASYLRLVNTSGKVHCTLLMSKARVAPLKPITIPRLELQGAVTASQLSQLISTELGMTITHTFWTDSQVVLGYLTNTTKKFHVYVTNRIQQVRDNSDPKSWNYVPTSINPADHASRGGTIGMLIQSNWFTGPDFLWAEPMIIPEQISPRVELDDPEVKSLMVTTENSPSLPTLYKLLHHYSSWTTAVKIAGVFIRKAHSTKNDSSNCNVTLASVLYIVKSSQEELFPEVQCLKEHRPISSKSRIFNLNPFLDEEGVMRVGGRLKHSLSLEYLEKHPIILPKTGHFTKILLRHFHEKVCHQGRGFTLAKMRSSGYWIVGARALVTSLIHKCVTCRIERAKPAIPQMSPLPSERSTESPPFSYCGVDCFGPFLVKDRRTELKRYGLMVTCLASRAVHIESLDDMSTPAFINAIRNVIAIRGPIREIWCDQGTNFIGAIQKLTEKGILEFKLNPPTASHMGGVWERMIRTARNVLQNIMKNHNGRLDTSSLRTLMYEVMAIINSRPLSTVTEEQVPLCPNLLLTMKSDIILPPPSEFTDSDIYGHKRWRAVQHLANVFWNRWRTEYLSYLQARQKWIKGCREVKPGDIVIIKDEKAKRNQWARGRIEECYKSKDGLVRSAKIIMGNRNEGKKSNNYLIRPVSKLITLIES